MTAVTLGYRVSGWGSRHSSLTPRRHDTFYKEMRFQVASSKPFGDRTIPNLAVSNSVTILPGCDRAYPTCVNKFNNAANHAGFPDLVVADPWDAGIALGVSVKTIQTPGLLMGRPTLHLLCATARREARR